MRPNRHMNGGLDQTSHNAYYVDDDAPRLILTISNFQIDDNESFVSVAAITRSSQDAIWHSDVLEPRLRLDTPNVFRGIYITADDLIYSF